MTSRKWEVHKLGGTSLGDASCYANVPIVTGTGESDSTLPFSLFSYYSLIIIHSYNVIFILLLVSDCHLRSILSSLLHHHHLSNRTRFVRSRLIYTTVTFILNRLNANSLISCTPSISNHSIPY